MRTHSLTVVAACLLVALTIPEGSHGKEAAFSINGGLASLTGSGSEYWNPGFAAGINGFYRIAPFVLVGARISYNRWTPDEDELVGDISFLDIEWDISGSTSIIEIAPSLRFLVPIDESPFRVFAQIGVGLYLLNMERSIKAVFMGETDTFEDERSENKVGVSFGAGIDISYFEILPMFSIVATEGESTTYYSINAGAAFSF